MVPKISPKYTSYKIRDQVMSILRWFPKKGDPT